jgi:ATP-dependent Clp protease adaptor protein ClpS
MSETVLKEETTTSEVIHDTQSIVIYNDEVNTFDFVIESLVKICKHDLVQAEQCTWIIHHNGKCAVKNGAFDNLKPMQEALCERGIDAKIK